MDMNYDDFTQWQVTPTMDVNTAQVQETILETLWVTIQGYQFHKNKEVEMAVNKWSWMQEDFYHNIIFKLMPKWVKFITVFRDYAEK